MIASSMLFVFTTLMAQNKTKAVTTMNPGNTIKINGPVARFDKLTADLGELTQNNPGTATFKLTNDGNEPLVISSAKASCGCTNLSYAKDPVFPGKEVSISATYNAASVGEFTKTITVQTNASEQLVVLQIKGKVAGRK